MIFVGEMRNECQSLLGSKRYILSTTTIRKVYTILPRNSNKFAWVHLVNIVIKDIHIHSALPVQLVVFFVKTKQMVVDLELWSDIISALVVLCEVSTCHRVYIFLLVVLEYFWSCLQHLIITVSIFACHRILLIYTHIRHLLVCQRQECVIVTLILGICH